MFIRIHKIIFCLILLCTITAAQYNITLRPNIFNSWLGLNNGLYLTQQFNNVVTPVFTGDTTLPFNTIYSAGYVAFNQNGGTMDFIRYAGVIKFAQGVRSVTDSIRWFMRLKIPASGNLNACYLCEYGETQAWVIAYDNTINIYTRPQGWKIICGKPSADTNWHNYTVIIRTADSTMKCYRDDINGVDSLTNTYTGFVYSPIAVTTPMQMNAHGLGFSDGDPSSLSQMGAAYTGVWDLDSFYYAKYYNGTDSNLNYSYNEGAGEYCYNYNTFLISDRDGITDTTMHFGHMGFSGFEIDSCNPAWFGTALKTGYTDIVYHAGSGIHTYLPLVTGQFNCFGEQWGMRGDTMTINDTLNILVCGSFNRINATIPPYLDNGDTVPSCFRWNGQAAVRIGSVQYFNNVVYKISHWGDTIFVGSPISTKQIAQYKPGAADFVNVGTGVNGDVYSMFVDTSDNTLIIGGAFTTAGGLGIARITKWTGAAYDTMGVMNSPVWNITRFQGSIYAGTSNGLKKWNGTTWDECGGAGYGAVYNTSVYGNELWCFGIFTISGSQSVAIWTGAAFRVTGIGLSSFVFNGTWSAAHPNGRDLYAVGSFYAIDGVVSNKVARWNGVQWSAVVQGGISLRPESCFMWKDQYNNFGNGINQWYLAVLGDQTVIGSETTNGFAFIYVPQ